MDWYSDESDETFFRDRELNLYNKIGDIHNSICAYEEEGLEVPESWKKELKQLEEEYEVLQGFNPITGKKVEE